MEYGLIGAKLGHSYSKPIHESVGGYAYELHPLPTEQQARAFLEERPFKAVNVTIPYKQLVIPYCSQVEPRAAAIGAVNTVINRGGQLWGYNTDYDGFAYLANRHGVNFAGKTVLILGTGGTHNTVTAVCRDAGAKAVLTAGRTGRGGSLTYAQAAGHKEVQIIVNTTPAGMYPNNGSCLVELAGYPALEAVLDVVYNPFKTELVLRAEELDIPAWSGFEMLVAQAVYAARLFTGREIPEETIDDIHALLKREISNFSLVGMPGSGKSSIGRALARATGKTYVDLDEKIERTAHMRIPDIFARKGEAEFRRLEQEMAARYGKEHGQVIACGGGIVKTPGNARLLRQNGPVLWVRRPVGELPMNGRPLSTGRERLVEMEAERRPLYEAAADAVIENTGTLAHAVEAAHSAFDRLFQGGA